MHVWFWNPTGLLPCRTVENLQLACEIARRNLQERADKQSESNEKLSIPQYQPLPGDHVLVHRPYTVADGPTPLFAVRSLLSKSNFSCCERW